MLLRLALLASFKVIWKCCGVCQHQLPTLPLLIDGCSVSPVRSARDLGIYNDCDLSMQTHIKHTVSRCFGSLCRLRQICRSVLTATLQMLVVALVHMHGTGLWYNGVLAGLPAYLIRQLQSVINAAARLICRLRSHDYITDALTSLHWLRSQSACSTSSLF